MLPDPAAQVERARAASGDELKALAHETSEEVLLAILENPHCEEPHVTILLDRLDLPANVLSAIAAQNKWIASEGVRFRIAAHPRTPKRIAIAVVRQLYLFDLVRLSLLPSAPADIKRAAEEIIVARVPQLPVGQKLTLARRGPSRVAGVLLAEGHAQAIKIALNNPVSNRKPGAQGPGENGSAGTRRPGHRPAPQVGLAVQRAHGSRA